MSIKHVKSIFVLISAQLFYFGLSAVAASPNYADNRELTVHEFKVPHLINIIIYLND